MAKILYKGDRDRVFECKPDDFEPSWNEWSSTVMMSPSTLMCMNSVPVEYIAATAFGDQSSSSFGQIVHTMVPILYACRDKKTWCYSFLRSLVVKYHDDLESDFDRMIGLATSMLESSLYQVS